MASSPNPVFSDIADLLSMARCRVKRLNGLNAAIGPRSIPLRTEVFLLQDVVKAHRRLEQGHVVGEVVLRMNS